LPGAAGFEDGTLPFTALGAVAPALDVAMSSGRERLAAHLSQLTAELLDALAELRHRDGSRLVVLHGPSNTQDRGATVAITLRRADGSTIPYWEAEGHARQSGIAVRGGCFCNPGSAEAAFHFSPEATGACLRALGNDFSIPRFAACLGDGPVGALRISLGLGSIRADVNRVAAWLHTYIDQ
jgi:selenocysteine lyase/cysteine desulfurase